MKIAIIADIHSNFDYFSTILKDIQKHNVDKIFCAGDFVGYYNKPNEVIEEVKRTGIVCVKGNHDKFLLGELSYPLAKDFIYQIKKQRKLITEENIEFIRRLPDSISCELIGKKIYMTHSFPNDSEKYLYTVEEFTKKDLIDINYYFYGHTHIPNIIYRYGTCLINPGSVGQPRDYSAQPSFVIVDMVNDECTLKKIHVDNLDFVSRLKKSKYPSEVITILERKNGKS